LEKFIETAPLWLLVVISLSIIVLLFRGVSIKSKVVSIDTKSDHWTSSVQSGHITQYRQLKTEIDGYIIASKGEFKSLFRSQFINQLKALGIDNVLIEQHEEVEMYEILLQGALDSVYHPVVLLAIVGNHFPVRKERESEKEYEERFFEEYTFKLTNTIIEMTAAEVSANWKSKKVPRGQYEDNYVLSRKTMKKVYSKMSALIIRCRTRRDFIFGQIARQDGSDVQKIKNEWGLIYG